MAQLQEPGLHRWRIQAVRRVYVAGNNLLKIGEDDGTGNNRRIPYDRSYFTDPNFVRQVRCQITDLFYLGAQGNAQHNTLASALQYWINTRRQYGNHVYAQRSGVVAVVIVAFDEAGDENITNPHLLAQLYPCVLCERQWLPAGHVVNPQEPLQANCNLEVGLNGGQQQPCITHYNLAVGLYYANYANQDTGYAYGSRLFSRLHDYDGLVVAQGGVFDLDEQELGNWANVAVGPNPRRFAIYVCAGAKLVVYDEYGPNHNVVNQHNRTLIQAGGVVIVECDDYLILRVPILGRNISLGDIIANNGTHPLVCENDLMAPLVRDAHTRNPVYFLGAHDSDHGSSVWELSIKRYEQTPTDGRRQCFLYMPECGHIEAITEWEDGMQEIWARHRYQELHRATVQMDNNAYIRYGWAAPTQDMALRIITNREEIGGQMIPRDIWVDIHRFDNRFRTRQLEIHQTVPHPPIAYNSHRVWVWFGDLNDPLTRPPMKPAFPLIQYDPAVPKLHYNKYTAPHTGGKHVKYMYDGNGAVRNETGVRDGWHTYEVSDVSTIQHIYQFERQGYGTDPEVACDGVNAYIGMDGYVWQKKQDSPPIGWWWATYYKRQPAAVAPQAAPQQQQPQPPVGGGNRRHRSGHGSTSTSRHGLSGSNRLHPYGTGDRSNNPKRHKTRSTQ